MVMSSMVDRSCKQPAAAATQHVATGGSAVAPPWHTIALVTVILTVAAVGTLGGRSVSAPAPGVGSRLLSYGAMLAVQWGLLYYVCRAGRGASALRALLGLRWDRASRAMGDLALALALFAAIVVIDSVWAGSRGVPASQLLPVTGIELPVWMLVAVSTGFCEEVVYRGYLQTQLTAFTRRAWAGAAMQAVLFGIAHADQGPAAVARVMTYGALLGLVAARRRSLIPGIVAHVGIDVAAAFT